MNEWNGMDSVCVCVGVGVDVDSESTMQFNIFEREKRKY